jgi:hypothetical protein
MLWPAKGEMGMLRDEEGKRVEKTFGVQAPQAKRRDVQGTVDCVSSGGMFGRVSRRRPTLYFRLVVQLDGEGCDCVAAICD